MHRCQVAQLLSLLLLTLVDRDKQKLRCAGCCLGVNLTERITQQRCTREKSAPEPVHSQVPKVRGAVSTVLR